MKKELTPTQQYLLRMFQDDIDEKTMIEVKDLLHQYFNEKIHAELKKIWKGNNFLNKTLLDAADTE